RLMRDGLSTMPSTLAPELATMFEEKDIAIMLEKVLAELLQEMTDQVEAFVLGEEEDPDTALEEAG
ncbi:MAG: hypothetical protein AAF368_20930, partial [Planctomycetota bacterium]